MRASPIGQDLVPNPSKRLILRRKDMAPIPILAWAKAGFKEPHSLYAGILIVIFVQND